MLRVFPFFPILLLDGGKVLLLVYPSLRTQALQPQSAGPAFAATGTERPELPRTASFRVPTSGPPASLSSARSLQPRDPRARGRRAGERQSVPLCRFQRRGALFQFGHALHLVTLHHSVTNVGYEQITELAGALVHGFQEQSCIAEFCPCMESSLETRPPSCPRPSLPSDRVSGEFSGTRRGPRTTCGH